MTRRRVLSIGALSLGLTAGAVAQLIPGGATEFTQLANNYELVASVGQLIQQLQQLKLTYDQIIFNAKMITNKSRWAGAMSPQLLTTGFDTYLRNQGWYKGVNTGQLSGGYTIAVERLNKYGTGLAYVPPPQQERVYQNYAAIERTDGTNQMAMTTIGQYRADEPTRRKAISDVLATANSDGKDNNSEVAVLNQIANANALNAQNTQSANALSSAILEEMILDQTQRRQLQAVTINSDVYFRQNAAAALSRHTTATTQALQNLRIP